MNPRIQFLLDGGESRHVEFKTARKTLNRDIYETVCAFLNRDGGEILLGVRDSGEVSGVDPERAQLMKQDFVNAINNPQKLTPPCYLSINTVDVEGALLLHIVVPPSSQIHRCNGRIFDRNEDGDFDITDNQALVTQRYLSKQSHYSENTIYPFAAMSDLDSNLIARARRLASVHQRSHPWETMDDQELLTSARLIQKDFLQNKEGLTLAAILLFGKDETILSVLPHHRTDAILRRVDVDRYDDRDDIRTNLLDSHDRLIAFGEKHLSDPFFLEGTQRISIRSHILREIIGNLLIHREYSHAFPAKFVIERDCLFSENSNRPHGHGPIDPRLFSPYPKNPTIAKVFKEIGWADELGSGVRKLFRYGKAFGGHDPELIEGDIFRINLPLTKKKIESSVENTELGLVEGLVENSVETEGVTVETGAVTVETEDVTVETEDVTVETEDVTVETEAVTVETEDLILNALRNNPEMTLADVATSIEKSLRTVERISSRLVREQRLKHVGPKKSGHWEVLP